MTFHISGSPVPQGRPRFSTRGGFPRAYDPAKSRDWKGVVRYSVAQQMAANGLSGPIEGPLAVAMTFRLPRPKSLPKRVTRHVKRPDVDNLVKGVFDAVNSTLWQDDSQVVELAVEKVYAADPGVTISVKRLEAA